MPWVEETWIDDDGSLTVGTEFDADKMNNIELGIREALEAEGGGGSDANFIFNQGPATKVWAVQHFLNKIPSVTVFDSEDNQIEGQIVPVNDDELEIHFNNDVSGKAVLN